MMSTSGGPPQVVPGGSVTPQKRNKSGSHPSPTPLMSAGPQQQQPTSNGQPPTLAGNQPSAIQPTGKAAASAAAANSTKHQPSVTQTPASVVGQPPFQLNDSSSTSVPAGQAPVGAIGSKRFQTGNSGGGSAAPGSVSVVPITADSMVKPQSSVSVVPITADSMVK